MNDDERTPEMTMSHNEIREDAVMAGRQPVLPLDTSVTTDLRPSAFDELREQNTTLAVENAELRELVRALEARNGDADRFLRRIERLRRAVARERAHITADHTAMDGAIERLELQEAGIRVLAGQRDDLLAAVRALNDTVMTLTGERNEARRALTLATRGAVKP